MIGNRSEDMLASSPAAFVHCANIRGPTSCNLVRRPPYFMTNKGLELKVPVPMFEPTMPTDEDPKESSCSARLGLIALDCALPTESGTSEHNLVHILLALEHGATVWTRVTLAVHIAQIFSEDEIRRASSSVDYGTITISRPEKYIRPPAVPYHLGVEDPSWTSSAIPVVTFNSNQMPSLQDLGLTASDVQSREICSLENDLDHRHGLSSPSYSDSR